MARTSGRLLVCRDVGISYGSVPVVFGVNLDVTAGEVVALLGTNGAGKSTLLRALTGVSPLSTGAIVFDGRDISALAAHERVRLGIITMPGGEAVLPSLSVADNLRAAGWDGSPAALELFPALRTRLPQPAGLLSGGEQQMLGLAQALLMKPRLLLIDELSLGLAPEAIGPLLDVVRGLRNGGTAVVLVEQSLDVALAIADRAVFMERGEVRFDGPPAALVGRDDLVRSVLLAGAAGGTRSIRPASAAPPDSTAPALDVRDIAVAYGGVQALDGASLTLVRGEIVGLLGANGAGKTTLFDVLSGFVPPDRGQVLLDGLDITAMAPQERARRGLVRSFQNARLFPALTVRECLAVAMERSTVRNPVLAALWAPVVRTSERRIAAKVDRLIDLLALAPYADRTVAELSTGTRRAVDIACVLALEPRVLLLDEPSAGLARPETEALEPLLRRLVRETGCALLVIEHDLSLVTSLADRLLSMSAGKVTPCRPVDA